MRGTTWFQSRFNYEGVPFFRGFAAIYVLDLAVTGAVLLALLRLKGRRDAFFLVRGDLDAPIAPVPWLGIRKSESWRKFVLIFATVNAFTEEVYFRASFLSTLDGTVGRGQTLLISVAFFGLSHDLHGSPPRLVGGAMTGFLAYLLGKAMLETRGLLAPWSFHFVPDAVIFASCAVAFVRR